MAPTRRRGRSANTHRVSSGAVTPSTGAVNNIATLPLTAGDWDVQGNVVFNPGGRDLCRRVRQHRRSAAPIGPASPPEIGPARRSDERGLANHEIGTGG